MSKVVTFILSLFLTFTFINSAPAQSSEKKVITQKILKFHPATSDAEKKLYHIIKLDEDDKISVNGYVMTWPHIKQRIEPKYKKLFTKDLIYDWSRMEKKMVDEACHGKHEEGEICGFDYNVLTCAQDIVSDYMYNTVKTDGNSATIELGIDRETAIKKGWDFPKDDLVATYRLIKNGNVWLLDGVKCNVGSDSDYHKFNWNPK